MDITSRRNKKVKYGLKNCNDNRNTFIATIHNVLLTTDLYDRLFLVIKLINSGHTCIFHKEFFTVYFIAKGNNAVTFSRSAQRKHVFLGKIIEKSKKKSYQQEIKLL